MPDLLERLQAALSDRYVIESEIGRGGMATVFLAEDLKHHRKVAIKVLHPELTASLAARRFLQEIDIAARLDHPHVIALFDSGDADGLLYYVMPFVEGESLRNRLDRQGQLPVTEAVRLAAEVTDALAYAHEHGVIHRDIKPGNILLSAEHARIADFGIARAIDAAVGERATATGLAVGTPVYMAPEQAAGDGSGDERSDVYALGCILYEMLAGEPPYTGTSPHVVQARKLTESAPNIRSIRDTVPPALERILEKALARSPADRYQSARGLNSALLANGLSESTATRPEERRQRHIGVLAAAVVVTLTLLGVGASMMIRNPGAVEEGTRIRSLAVLPLRDISYEPKPQQAAGVTDELRHGMSRLSSLRIPSMTTMLRYQEADRSLPEIARELGVDAVLEGSIRWSVDSVQLWLRLIEGTTDRELWSNSYAVAQSDVQTLLQSAVVTELADGMQLALTPIERERLVPPADPADPEAYEAYVTGRYHAIQWTREEVQQAEEYFRKAVAIDPGFVEAGAALVDTRCVLYPSLGMYELTPSAEECESQARDLIERDAGLAEAHAALAMALNRRWDWQGAEDSFRRALELDPNAAGPRMWYGWFLTQVSRPQEGLGHARAAEDLDPVNPFVRILVTQPLLNLHRYEEALAQVDSVLRLAPEHGAAFIYQAQIHLLMGETALAQTAVDQVGNILGEDQLPVVALRADIAAREGDEARARDLMAKWEEEHPAMSTGWQAYTFLYLNREDEALEVLERAYVDRYPWLPNMTSAPQVDPIRSNPRFRALRQAMGLPPG